MGLAGGFVLARTLGILSESEGDPDRASGAFEGSGGGEGVRPMMSKIMIDTFDGRPLEDEEHTMAVFERHNQEVIDTIVPERLLVFEAHRGWEPLCEFLGVAVPDMPYMALNTREQFGKRAEQMEQQARP
jgi:hypothetical protein